MLKVMSVFGVRPEAIKMAPIIKELERYPEQIESVIVVTGQHREMLHQVLEIFEITPDYDLDIMQRQQTLVDIFERSMRGLDNIYKEEKPDIVLVHGDTLTSFIAALTAFYNKITVGHVEAGLRTYQKYFPFPEEINRCLTAVLADLHFSPTEQAAANLLAERIPADRIFITGNTVIDALKYTVKENFNYPEPELANRPWRGKRLVVAEVHRRENWGEPIAEICRALRDTIEKQKDAFLVFPVHLNPVVRKTVWEYLADRERVLLLDPLGTDSFHNLIAEAEFLVSDSGGVQEEAPALGTPVLVTRDVTERPEAVAAGTVEVVGTTYEKVASAITEMFTDEEKLRRMSRARNPYGDGLASQRTVLAIMRYFGLTEMPFIPWRGECK